MNRSGCVAVMVLVIAVVAVAAGPAGAGGPATGVALTWDRAQEVTVQGTVVTPPVLTAGAASGSPMTIRTDAGVEQRVLLGPPGFVTEIGLRPAAGETVEVVGLPIQEEGQQAIVARQVTAGGTAYQLRTASGVPLWTGRGSPRLQRYAELWNPGQMETVSGRVEALGEVWPGGRTGGAGTTLQLRTAEGRTVLVHLGPAWAVAGMLPNLRAGEQVTVRGSQVRYGNQDVLLAETVTRAGRTTRLRSAEGTPQWAGGWRNWGGWGPGSRYGRLYNPASAGAITGQIVRVGRITPMNRSGQGLGIVVRTAQGRELLVHLAPAWYAQQLGLEPKVGDEVRVTGSIVQVQGRQVMLASTIDWHDEHVQLRAANGQPLWSGGSLARR